MKFKEIMIERNFRISNDDQYAKERMYATVILDDGEDEQKAMNLAREKIVQNFKAAYPKVYTHLNFDESVSYNNNLKDTDKWKWTAAPIISTEIESENGTSFTIKSDLIDPSYKYPVVTTEMIKKEMLSYKLGAKAFEKVYGAQCKGNPELEETYNNKLKELSK